jgi:ABC-type branched-subunit amino acid transport system substrate-binding protein
MSRSLCRPRGRLGVLAAVAVCVVGAVGCSSGSPSTGGTSGARAVTGQQTFTVGLLTDLTGLAASASKTSVDGVKAGVVYAARNGYNIKFVVADTETNPSAVLSAAQKLVTQDHVGAVLATSALTLLAAPYLTARGVPVIGFDSDGPEWTTAKNMFAVNGALNATKVLTSFGDFMKSRGVTTVGALGYGASPVSAENTKADAASAEVAGLEVGYLNANFPFGSTNVAPVAIAMRNKGVDGLAVFTEPSTVFALINALKQQGVAIKAAVLGTGYGSELLEAGPGAEAGAQNAYFVMSAQPFGMQTVATKQFAADLKAVGVTTTQATFAQYSGYLSVGLLVRALNGAGSSLSYSSIIASLTKIHDWNGMGLLGTLKVDINDRSSFVSGPNNCFWAVQLKGTAFIPVSGALPFCGKLIPGKTVSASS